MDCIFCSLFCCDYKQSAEEEMRLHQLLEFQSCRLEIVPRTMLKTIRKFTRGGLLRWKKESIYAKDFKLLSQHFCFQSFGVECIEVLIYEQLAPLFSHSNAKGLQLLLPVAISPRRSRILVKAGSDKQRCTLNRLGISSGGRQKLIRRGQGRRESTQSFVSLSLSQQK